MTNIVDTRAPPGQLERDISLLELLQRVWTYAFTTKSDTARDYADEVAEAASRGFLTTQVVPGKDVFGRVWKITCEGLQWLGDNASSIADREVDNYAEVCGAPTRA